MNMSEEFRENICQLWNRWNSLIANNHVFKTSSTFNSNIYFPLKKKKRSERKKDFLACTLFTLRFFYVFTCETLQ